MNGAAEAIRILREGKRFWLASHIRVDGDGLGSLLGLSLALRKAGKEVQAINQGPLPRQFAFLPGYETISGRRPRGRPDAFITLDVPDTERLGVVRDWIPEGVPVINLDHHVSNRSFGQVNVVEPERSATGEIVYLLLRDGEFAFDPDIATCLYAAIYTDTGRFSYTNTRPETLEVSAHLLRMGAAIRGVSKGTYESRTRRELDLQARAIDRLAVDAAGEIAWSYLRIQDIQGPGSRSVDAHDLVDIPRSLRGVKIAVFFREVEGAVRVSLRSEGSLDVSAIAAGYGGGGHTNSAGCTIRGDLTETMNVVLRRVREALNG